MKTIDELGVFWQSDIKDDNENVISKGKQEVAGVYMFFNSVIINHKPSIFIEKYKKSNELDYSLKEYNDRTILTIKIINNEFKNLLSLLEEICLFSVQNDKEIEIWGGGEFCPIFIQPLDIEDEDIYFYYHSKIGFLCNSNLDEEYKPLTESQLLKIKKSRENVEN